MILAQNLIFIGSTQHMKTQELEISFKIPHKDFKWEPLVRQFIKLEQGTILEQDKSTDCIHFKVSFENHEKMQVFSDSLADIGIKQVV